MELHNVYKVTMACFEEDVREVYERHMEVSEHFDVKETAELYYEGTCVSFEREEGFYCKEFKVSDMGDGLSYKFLSAHSETSDYQIYVKEGNVITCTLVGIEFPETGFSFSFDLNIIKDQKLKHLHFDEISNQLTLGNLEELQIEIFHQFLMEKIEHPLVKEIK